MHRQLEELTTIIAHAPERAREAARGLLTEITLTPAIEDGEEVYQAVGGAKTNSAARLGGRVLVNDGCGGLLSSNCASLEIPKVDLYARGRRGRTAA